MVILGEGAHLGKHDAEDAQFGAAANKQRWEASQLAQDDDSQAKELLAWELEQEQWTEKSDTAILEDPHWQRVGIERVESTSPFSDDERQPLSHGRQSPVTSQTLAEPSRTGNPMSPTRSLSFSQSGSDGIFLEDQRLVQQPMSPGLSVVDQRTGLQAMSPGMSVVELRSVQNPISPMSVAEQRFGQNPVSPRMSPGISSEVSVREQRSIQNPLSPGLSVRDQRITQHPTSPGLSLRHQRAVQQPMSPGMSVQKQRIAQQPMSPGMSVRSSHQLEAAWSPTSTPHPSSPSPSVRSSSSHINRYKAPEPNYLYSPQPQQTSGYASTQASEPSSHFNVFGQETLGMRMRSFSPPAIILQSSSMSGRYTYIGPNDDHFQVNDTVRPAPEIQAQIAPAYNQKVPHSGSWNSYAGVSQHSDADQLEAEFARLEGGRGRGLDFPGVLNLEERDEQDARRSAPGQKMGYELEELEEEYRRLEIRNKEPIAVSVEEAGDGIIHLPVTVPLENLPSDGVIHLEHQASLVDDDDDDVPDKQKFPSNAVGIEELEAEFDEAVRRKEALLRNCSMDSNDGDDILGEKKEEAPKEEIHRTRRIPVKKSRWQEKLERFERRGLADAEANLDVSKYPRLQQIRQRRRERLKALMTIRQERSEIWDTLEANWEQMDHSMTRRLAADFTGKNRGEDPEPASPRVAAVDLDQDVAATKDDDTQVDSLRLSSSEERIKEADHQEEEESKEAFPFEPEDGDLSIESHAYKPSADVVASGNEHEDPVVSVADLVEDLVEDIIEQISLEGIDLSAVDADDKEIPPIVEVERAASVRATSPNIAATPITSMAVASPRTAASAERAVSPTPTTSDAIPASTVSLLESITGKTSDRKKAKAGEREEPMIPRSEPAGKKEDPPPSFGAYISQNMSDVGTQVVNILNSVRSKEEQQPVVASQGTDTYEEEASQVEAGHIVATQTEEARDDDETSTGMGLDLVGFEEEDADLDHQGCVNPLQNMIGKHRRIVVEDVAGQGCINPLVRLGFGGVSPFYNCASVEMPSRGRAGKRHVPGFIVQLSSADSDIQDDVGLNQSEDDQKSLEASQSDDRDLRATAPTPEPDPPATRVLARKSKRSKKGKNKKAEGGVGVDTFFTLVDDLLVNKILNIVDEKVVDNMAHTFGFD